MKITIEINNFLELEELREFLNGKSRTELQELIVAETETMNNWQTNEFKQPEQATVPRIMTPPQQATPAPMAQQVPVPQPVPVPVPQPVPVPVPQPQTTQGAITIDQVRAKVAPLVKAGKLPQMTALFAEFGAQKLTDIDPSNYAAIMARIDTL